MNLKNLVLFSLPFALLILTGCNGKEKARQEFAERLAAQISKNQLDSVRLYYPEAANIDSLSLTFDSTQVKIIPEEGNSNRFSVEFAPGKSIKVTELENGKFKITESTGIFAWPSAIYSKAKSYGMIEGNPTDAALAKRIAAVDSVTDFIYNEYVKNNRVNITIGSRTTTHDYDCCADDGTGYYTIYNKSGRDVAASDYTITIRHSTWGMFDGERNNYETIPGLPIEANETARVPVHFSCRYEDKPVKINPNIKSRADFEAEYKPSGNEYARYKAGK